MSKTTDAIVAAAERLNRTNVRDALNVGTRNGMYRENMSAEARKLDEAFQAHYEAQQPSTTGPQPLPLARERVGINAADVGITLKSDQATMDAIADEVARHAPPRAMR